MNGYLCFAPEPRKLIVGNLIFDPPPSTRAMVVIDITCFFQKKTKNEC